MNHRQLCEFLAGYVLKQPDAHPVRVGVNGIDASGKSYLARTLEEILRQRTQRRIIRSSIDDFHNPRAVRYQRGEVSPEGYYLDSFNFARARECLLDPLSPGGGLSFRRRGFDLANNRDVYEPRQQAAPDSILIFEGVFLFRPELADCFDIKIFLHIDYEECIRRARIRDEKNLGSGSVIDKRYRAKYLPAQKRYLAECDPASAADIVIDNNDPERAVVREGKKL